MFGTKTKHRGGGYRLWFGRERSWAPPWVIVQYTPMKITINQNSLPAPSSPEVRNRWRSLSGREKYATGSPTKTKCARNNLVIGKWNGLRKLEQLEYVMKRYKWNILGLYEERWKKIHKLYYSRGEDRQDTVGGVMACRLMSIWLKAKQFNTTIIQGYVSTIDHDDEEVDDFYNQL